MKKRTISWLACCLGIIMAIGFLAFAGCPTETTTGGGDEYTITIDPAIENGRVTTRPAQKAAKDAQISVTVTPDAGYQLISGSLKYTAGGSATDIPSNRRFNMPANNVTITAQFVETGTPATPSTTYTVTAGSLTNGAITANPASGVMGTTITLTVTPESGYRLKPGSLQYSPGTPINETTKKFNLPARDVTVTAEFESNASPIDPDATYTVTVAGGITGGTVSVNPRSGKPGTIITVTVTPAANFVLIANSLQYTTAAGSTPINETTRKFGLPAENVTVTARFGSNKIDYSGYRDELEAIIDDMTLNEKIGQMAQVERGQISHPNYGNEVKQYFMGSVLSGGGSGPGAGTSSSNTANSTPLQWWTYTNRMLEASMENTPKGNMTHGIPYVYGIDAVHGHGNAIQHPTIFPHNIGMGAIYVGDPVKGAEAGFAAGKITAIEMYATGHRFNFNPVLGVGENTTWGRMYESYSQHPDVVAAMGSNYVRGIQWDNTVGACGKHYGFEGQVSGSSNVTSGNAAVGDLNTENNRHMISPYKAAIDAGLLSVMTYYGQVNNIKPVRYKALLDILKVDWGFEGFIITDWADMGTSGDTYKNNIMTSINAGVDMAMLANSRPNWLDFITHLKALVEEGSVSEERINDAVYRILLFKKVFKILDEPVVPQPDPFPNGSEEHRETARDIAAKTLVLLKNEDDVVGKLAKGEYKNILVTGTSSDHMGNQCGGWTREWQGITSSTISNFSGVTIIDGLQNAKHSGMTVQRSENGAAVAGFTPDVIIAVAGETPYAEGSGDTATPSIGSGKGIAADITMLTNAYAQNVPVILIVISGRPLRLGNASTAPDMTQYRDKSKGIVAAWLPGSQAGDAIADVLLGSKDFVGKSSFTWYANGSNGTVSYPFGWGLKKGQTDTYDPATFVPPTIPRLPTFL